MSLRLSRLHRSTIRARRDARARCRSRIWLLEGLEGRVLLSGNPTYYTVNLTSDIGASSGTRRRDRHSLRRPVLGRSPRPMPTATWAAASSSLIRQSS